MKKTALFFVTAVIVLASNIVFANDNDITGFIKRFNDCTVYRFKDYNGIKQIQGWRAGKCLYRETDAYGQVTQCYFEKDDLQKLTDLMNIYNGSNSKITMTYTNGETETFDAGSATMWNWTQYLNMIGVCSAIR